MFRFIAIALLAASLSFGCGPTNKSPQGSPQASGGPPPPVFGSGETPSGPAPTEAPKPEVARAMRVWSLPVQNTEVLAKAVAVGVGEVVLQKPDGSQMRVAIGELSPNDRQFLLTGIEPPAAETARYGIIVDSMPNVQPWTAPDELRDDPELGAIFRVESIAPPQVLPNLEGMTGTIVAMAISESGEFLAACSELGECRVWATATGKHLGKYETNLPGKAFAVAISPDGRYAHVGCMEGGVHTWEVKTGVLAKHHQQPGTIVAVQASGDGKHVAFVEQPAKLHRYPALGGVGGNVDLRIERNLDLAAIAPDAQSFFVGFHNTGRAQLVRMPRTAGATPTSFTAGRLPVSPTCLALSKRLAVVGLAAPAMAAYCFSTEDGVIPQQELLLPCNWPAVDAVQISSDDAVLLAANLAANEVATHFTDAFGYPVRHRLDWSNATAVALGRDGRTVAAGFKDGLIRTWRLNAIAGPQAAAERLVLRLRNARDFARLEASLERWEELSDSGLALPWSVSESPSSHLFNTLLEAPNGMLDEGFDASMFLKEWRAARPDSVWPAIAEASWHIDEAWKARGGGTADTVTLAGWDVFRKRIADASRLLEALWTDENAHPPATAYQLLFVVMMAESRSTKVKESYAEKLMRDHPRNLSAHSAYLNAQSKKWGANGRALADHQRRVADAIGGLEGDGYFGIEFIMQYWDWSTQQSGDDVARSFRGLKYLSRRYPKSALVANLGLLQAGLYTSQVEKKYYADMLAPLGDPCIPSVWLVHKDNVEGFYAYLKEARGR